MPSKRAADPVIAATGLYTPPHSISNEELVASYNRYAEQWNAGMSDAIAAGETEAKVTSSTEFIEKASGIKSRFVMDKGNVLDPAIMAPRLPERSDGELSLMAEIGVAAARDALERAGREAGEVDAVLCACSNMQRPYPAMAVEIQDALGLDEAFAFDMKRGLLLGRRSASRLPPTSSVPAMRVRCWW